MQLKIVQKVPLTPTQLSNKHHHHGGAVCPSYGMGSMDLPGLTQVPLLKGSAKGAYAGFHVNC